MSGISPRTAELALISLRKVLELTEVRRNGTPIPADILAAFAELGAAYRAGSPTRTTLDTAADAGPHCEQISVAEAAQRLGISRRAVQMRCAAGLLPATRLGRRVWRINWRRP